LLHLSLLNIFNPGSVSRSAAWDVPFKNIENRFTLIPALRKAWFGKLFFISKRYRDMRQYYMQFALL